MPSNEKERAATAISVATKWRKETGVHIGYVMVYNGKFFEFSEEFPDYGDRKMCPSAVDINDNVFVVVGNERRWDNIFVSKRGNGGVSQEHISVIAMKEMCLCFPQFAKDICAWFSNAKTEIKSSKWKRFELITLRQAFDCMYAGISLDRVLNGAVKRGA